MNSARRGNSAEVKVAKRLESEGWIVGSRRHIGGAGDLLAASTLVPQTVLLIEVKATKRPWTHFRPADRQALLDTAKLIGARPYLIWWPPKDDGPNWFPEEMWPR